MPMIVQQDVVMLTIADIFSDDEFNSRGRVAPIDVTDLSNSIGEDGLLSPIIVAPWSRQPDKKWRVVCGHRRLMACILLDWKEIAAFIRPDLDETKALILNLQENIQRQDLNILQEALAIGRFTSKGWDPRRIGQELGMSRGWVDVRLRLLELPQEIQQKAAAGLLTQYQIKEIAMLPTRAQQFEAAKKAVDHKLTEGKAVKLVKKPENLHKKKIREISEVHRMQDHLREALGNNLATRALGWVGGHISTYEMFQSIEQEAAKQGKAYIIPTSLDEVE